jgi:nitrite reductase/ring-hydroxylating ferredoxin subunit
VSALHDVCGHMGGPLHEGAIENGCVTCPWHGSVFRLSDGSVVHGPGTAPQPVYEVRRAGGRVSVRRRR